MYKVIKRDCPMFGIGPYLCEFICDTASDISTLPTFSSEGTGGRTVYDNQKCASGSMAIVADNGAESKQYILNNQDIWCPYSVAAGSSEHQDLSEYAKKTDVPSIKVNSAVNADTVNGHTVNADVPADAKFTDTVPDLAPYALKSKYGDTTIDVGRKADTTVGRFSTAEGYNATASGTGSHAEGYNATASGTGSHVEGGITTAFGDYSHAEGYKAAANEDISHAEGRETTAGGMYSHAEGYKAAAGGLASHAGGTGTKALHDNEVAYGKYNESKDDTLFSVGDGTADDARHNAFEITTSGGKLHDKDIATTDLIPIIKSINFSATTTNGYIWTGIAFPKYVIGVDLGHFDIIVQFYKGNHADAGRAEWAMKFFNMNDVTTPLNGSFNGTIYYIG